MNNELTMKLRSVASCFQISHSPDYSSCCLVRITSARFQKVGLRSNRLLKTRHMSKKTTKSFNLTETSFEQSTYPLRIKQLYKAYKVNIKCPAKPLKPWERASVYDSDYDGSISDPIFQFSSYFHQSCFAWMTMLLRFAK